MTAVAVVGLLVSLLGWSPSQADGAASLGRTAYADESGDKIAPGLERRFERTGNEAQDFWVSFEQTADTSKAREIDDWAERGQYVVDRLQETAKEEQADTIELLEAAGAEYTTFWISNAIRVELGDYALAHALAAQPEVERVFAPVMYEQPDPVDERLTRSRTGPNVEGTVEWGVENIRADQVWEQYGVRGDGIVVANIDTGVQFDHPALVDSYRGSNGDGTFTNDYNWFDPTGQYAFPSDPHGHGTHTMGTMVGDDGGANQIGIAPGATWIAARGCETNQCSDNSLMLASQWMLAPTRADGSAADPAMRPNVINNSWGQSPPSNEPFLEDIQKAWADAGIMGVWSNGNDGELGCQSSGAPGSRTLNYSVGAYDIDNNIGYFSGRGPGQDGEIKPNISAPGVDIRSSWIGSQYASVSGTSMAAPHAAGTVALLWSADPTLIGDIDATRQLLDDTAVDTPDDQCGGSDDDNNVYGEGRIDALALVDATDQTNLGTVDGVVTDDESGDAVRGATVRLSDGATARSVRTGDDGAYTVNIPAGEYQATVSAFGYETKSVPVSVSAGQTTTADVQLTAAPGFTLSGVVVDKRSGQPIQGVTITVAGSRFAATTDRDGAFAVEHIPGPRRYIVTVDPPGGCSKAIRRSIVVDSDVTLPVLKLARYTDQYNGEWRIPYGYSCVMEPTSWIGGDTPIPTPPGDHSLSTLDLPFSFTYFGQQYETILVDFDGRATFDADIGHSAVLNVFWDPSVTPEAMLTSVTGAKPNRVFTIEWRDLHWPNGVPDRISVALSLHENGDIVYAYKDLDPTKPWQLGDGANVGLSSPSPDGRAGLRTDFVFSAVEPSLSSDRAIRFELPPNGFVAGRAVDRATGKPVANATVDLYNEHGTWLIRKATDADGRYRLQLMTGQTYFISVVKSPAFEAPPRTRVQLTADREVRRVTTTLHSGRIQLSENAVTLRQGETARVRLTNLGDRRLEWWSTTHEAGATPPPGSDLDSIDVSSSFPVVLTSLAQADDTWWAAGALPGTLIELDHGHPTGAEIDLASVAEQVGWSADQLLWPTGSAWLPDRGWLCLFPSHLVVDTIACVDPDSSQVRAEIPTGYQNGSLQASDLAYDPHLDLFYMTVVTVENNKTRLRTLEGLDHPAPGTVRHTCVLPDDSLGLAYNPATRTLWTGTEQSFSNPERPIGFSQLEPQHCTATIDARLARSGLRYGDTDIDEDGNLLVPSGIVAPTISTVQTPDPIADEIPWLQVSMTQGSLKPHRSQEIRVDVDWDAVPAGVTGAKLVFRGNGGARSKVVVPLRLAETRRGTAGSDRIVGTDGPDTILGLGGDDTLLGRGGADRIVGAPGADVVMGGGGADDLYGGRGADRITPGTGVDTVSAGLGADTVHLRRDGKADTVRCGPGRDRVIYHSRRDPHDTLQGCERVLIRS